MENFGRDLERAFIMLVTLAFVGGAALVGGIWALTKLVGR